MKTVLAIAIYNYKSLFRNFKSAGIMFILPVIFIGLFGVAFGAGGDIEAFNIGMIKSDNEPYEAFKTVLSDLRQNEASERELFTIEEYDSAEDAEAAVKDEQISLYLTVDEDFYPGGDGGVTVYGETLNPLYNATAGIIQSVAAGYMGQDLSFYESVSLESQNTQDLSPFDYLAPGLIVYSILILMPGIAQDFTEITEKSYIFRYFTSKTKSWQILLGTGLYQFSLAFVQTLISYATAVAIGFNAEGNVLNGLVVAIPTGIFVVAVGLLIGGAVKKVDTATNIGTMLSIILGFFSGSFISGIGRIWEFELFGSTIQFNDLLPTKWATVAMETVLRDNGSLSDVSGALAYITASSVVLLVISVLIYRQRQLKRLD